MNLQKGFTLIELLATIAIIGILASSVLAAVGQSRAKARDAKRLSSISDIQKSLELYYDYFQAYPVTVPVGYSGTDAALQMLHATGYLRSNTSSSSEAFLYRGGVGNMAPYTECITSGCAGYSLAVLLEREENPIFIKDADARVTNGVVVFEGASSDCGATVSVPDLCLDVTPLQIQQ